MALARLSFNCGCRLDPSRVHPVRVGPSALKYWWACGSDRLS